MTTREQGEGWLKAHELLAQWADTAESFVYTAPSGKTYAFLTERDGEGPAMQFAGNTPMEAWSYLRNRTSRYYK